MEAGSSPSKSGGAPLERRVALVGLKPTWGFYLVSRHRSSVGLR
ncbi:hypothetical protein [Verminephrobacter eiseniae]|nr:hypothetical protein [Verminephrobacter eiseniae]